MTEKEEDMPYIVTPLTVKVKQISYEDILNNNVDVAEILRSRAMMSKNNTSTRTYYYDEIPLEYYWDLDLITMIGSVAEWNRRHDNLFRVDRRSLYTRFRRPKRSGGWRNIDAPNDELKAALRELKDIFQFIYKPLYHTSAFGFIPGRQALDAVKRHQRNNSWWFLKTDFSDFFGSNTPEFVWKMITQVFPFSEVVKSPVGERELRRALSLCFLSGGLPQGTPISPFLTNVIMIPIDFRFSRDFRNRNGELFDGNHFVYTRYADDINISCKATFNFRDVLAYMRGVLAEFGAPYRLKDEKTHYGSRNGRNWILGVMLNKDNKITIGHKKKRDYKAMVHNYIHSLSGGEEFWALDEVQYVLGLTSYYRDVEPSFIDEMVDKYTQKNNIDYIQSMKEAISKGGHYVAV